jgi:hypothetical protein
MISVLDNTPEGLPESSKAKIPLTLYLMSVLMQWSILVDWGRALNCLRIASLTETPLSVFFS